MEDQILQGSSSSLSSLSSSTSSSQEINSPVSLSGWPLLTILEETTINQVLGEYQKDIVSVRETATLSEALKLLADLHLHSLPVLTKDSVDVIGFVDVLDVLTYVLSLCSEGQAYPDSEKAFENAIMMYQKGFSFAKAQVSDVIDFSSRDPMVPVYGNGTLAQVIEEAFSRGLHRVAVFNKHHEILTNVMTQSDMLHFVMEKIKDYGTDIMGPLQGKTVDELHLGTMPAVTMSDQLTAFEALQLIAKQKVRAIAIVDKLGELVADFSATEVQGLSPNNFSSLSKPVISFLERSLTRHLRRNDFPFSTPLICTGDTPIETVLTKLHTLEQHRIWIVDAFARPTGVITLTDILRLFMSTPIISGTASLS